jgi:DNA-binding transcriptional LysR family regulator
MNDTWPETSFTADVLSEDLMVKRLVAQTMDLAFLITACELEHLNCEAVSSFELALHTTGLKSLEQVLGESYVYVEWGRDVGPTVIKKLGFRQQPVLSTGDHLIARNFLEANGGSAFLPTMPAGSDSRLQVIAGSPRVKREIFALWHSKNPSQALIGEIVDTLRARCAAASAPISSNRG